MNTKAIMFRKKNVLKNGARVDPSRKQLEKQVTTLHKKLKKNDEGFYTEFVIERDGHHDKYHTHMIVHYNDEANLRNQLKRFIGGSRWGKRMCDWGRVNYCYGKFGEVDLVPIYNESRFRRYLNKKRPTRTLV